jgi:hypothetical protein
VTATGTYQPALAARVVELLADGEWHNYEQVVRELMKVVPPGPAIRRAEQDRIASNRGHKKADEEIGPRVKPRGTDELIRSGRRAIVRAFLRNVNYETDRPGRANRIDPERRIRMLRKPQAFRPYEPRSDAALREEVRELRLQVARMRLYLKEIGHHRAAARLAPEEDN